MNCCYLQPRIFLLFFSLFYKFSSFFTDTRLGSLLKLDPFYYDRVVSPSGMVRNCIPRHDPEIKFRYVPKMDFDECYYQVLEVGDHVDYQELKKAYYKLVFLYHPDNKLSSTEKEQSNLQMMVINGAYRVLKNPETRSKYDEQRKKGLFGARAGVKGSGVNDLNSEYHRKRLAFEKLNPPDTSNSKKSTADEILNKSRSFQTDKVVLENERQNKESQPAMDDEPFQMESDPDMVRSPTATRFYKKLQEQGYVFKRKDVRENVNNGKSSALELDAEWRQFNARERVSGRGNGSVGHLKLYLKSLRKEYNILMRVLRQDDRDWGLETNDLLIRQRLKDLQKLRELELKISDLEDEIEGLTYYTDYNKVDNGRSSYEEKDLKTLYDSLFDGYDDNNWTPIPQPQPQRQGDDDQNGQRRWPGRDLLDDSDERLWRNRRRPKGFYNNWNNFPTSSMGSGCYHTDLLNSKNPSDGVDGRISTTSQLFEDNQREEEGA